MSNVTIPHFPFNVIELTHPIDTLSADKADSDYPVHRALLGAGKYLVKNIAYAEQLPAVGSYNMALPILTVGGTEAPIRLIGLTPL